jgi:hypothetical protein
MPYSQRDAVVKGLLISFRLNILKLLWYRRTEYVRTGEGMEIFGGFMVMMSILGLFLAVVWLIMPFVVFAIKNKQDRSLEILEGIDKRLVTLEQQFREHQPQQETHAAATAAEQTSQPTVLPLA